MTNRTPKHPVEGAGTLYVAGAVLGLGLGLVSAHMYKRALEENGAVDNVNAVSITSADAVKIGLLLMGAVRGIAELAAEKNGNPEKQ